MEIIEIKSKLTLVQVLHYYHFEPDRNQRLCCPWHDDKTPSLQIYPKANTWTCFSSNCSAGSGDQIDFIMKIAKMKDKQGNITSLYGRSIADLKGSNHYYTRNRKGLYPCYPSEDTKPL